MARYEHLPIYKKAMDVAVHFEKVVAGFSRYHMYTLGTELRNKSREIVSLIVKANSTKDRLSCLLELREKIEELVILVRLCKEVRAFKSFKSFQYAIEEINMVGRQNEG
ncbi:MAG: four helix bundle protein [Nitrospira sp.]|nr:four helix bundle protein [bacterium]MBL7048625.1 four helix bundle protein [Nitrospira sp.]